MAFYVGCTDYLSECVSVGSCSDVLKAYRNKLPWISSANLHRAPFYMRPKNQVSTDYTESNLKILLFREQSLLTFQWGGSTNCSNFTWGGWTNWKSIVQLYRPSMVYKGSRKKVIILMVMPLRGEEGKGQAIEEKKTFFLKKSDDH